MPEAGRKGDLGHCPADSHGCPACPHDVKGPATDGSENVLINAERALRVGDPGVHSSCCGPNQWQATGGAPGVFINGKKAHRKGDAQAHCGGDGQLSTGSGNVIIGDLSGGAATADSHALIMPVEYRDAVGRLIEKVKVRIVCPHRQHPEQTIAGKATLSGLCKDAAVLLLTDFEHHGADKEDEDPQFDDAPTGDA
ncbi:MAG: hypothetical protein JNK72_10175 [Myxococcales bacterium]|nr:hypothetical protein [Myxococcales bacterium]